MYKLYYSPGACSMAVHAILNEINVPYETQETDKAYRQSEDFLKINPRGAVPVLVDDGFVIREGAAIISYLCDTHGFPHWPQSGHGRAACLQWLAYCNATLHTAYSKVFWLKAQALDEATMTQLCASACATIQSCWDELNQQLSHSAYLCGEQVCPADFLMTTIANWNQWMPTYPGCDIILGDNVKRTCAAVSSRPSFQKAMQSESVTYKAAA